MKTITIATISNPEYPAELTIRPTNRANIEDPIKAITKVPFVIDVEIKLATALIIFFLFLTASGRKLL